MLQKYEYNNEVERIISGSKFRIVQNLTNQRREYIFLMMMKI